MKMSGVRAGQHYSLLGATFKVLSVELHEAHVPNPYFTHYRGATVSFSTGQKAVIDPMTMEFCDLLSA